jgi:hypothetical protein
MHTAEIILWDTDRQWLGTLRRHWPGPQERIRPVETWEECGQWLECFPASLVLLAGVPDESGEIGRWLERLHRDFPRTRAVVLMFGAGKAAESILRTAGAIHVITSARSITDVVRLAERHLAQAPRRTLTTRQWVWSRLPWAPAGDAPPPRPD